MKSFEKKDSLFKKREAALKENLKKRKKNHLLLKKNNHLIGYSRIFRPGEYFKQASIGRVLVKKNERKNKYGSLLMELSIKAIEDTFKEKKIKISAQIYLTGFYKKLGFLPKGEEYLEDGIPHIAMLLN